MTNPTATPTSPNTAVSHTPPFPVHPGTSRPPAPECFVALALAFAASLERAAAAALALAADALDAEAEDASTLLVSCASIAVAGVKPELQARQAVGSAKVVDSNVVEVPNAAFGSGLIAALKFPPKVTSISAVGSMRMRSPIWAKSSVSVAEEMPLFVGSVALVEFRGTQEASV